MIYAVSDLHGNGDAWKSLKKALNPNDMCIVLGDACDRGRQGIEILCDIMEDKRFKYIVGNHDDFILRTYRPDLVKSNIRDSSWGINNWLYNKGSSYEDWENLRKKRPHKFKRLIEWLSNCDAFCTMYVNDTIYRLAHAKYPKNADVLHMSWKDMEQLDSQLLYSTLWERYGNKVSLDEFVSPGCITLIGHTPIPNDNQKVTEGLYNLDTGLGYGYDELTVYCLSDGFLYTVQNGGKLPKGNNGNKKIINLKLECFLDRSQKRIYDAAWVQDGCAYDQYTALGCCTDPVRGFDNCRVQTSIVQKVIIIDNITLICTRNSVYHRI